MFTAFNTENLRPLTKKNVERESEPEPTGIKKPGSGADQKKYGFHNTVSYITYSCEVK